MKYWDQSVAKTPDQFYWLEKHISVSDNSFLADVSRMLLDKVIRSESHCLLKVYKKWKYFRRILINVSSCNIETLTVLGIISPWQKLWNWHFSVHLEENILRFID